MMTKRLYICDGKVPTCHKTFCAYNGTGDCMHTSNIKHARYKSPREWRVYKSGSETILFERERPDGE